MQKKSFLIIGMGSFGKHLCRFLTEQGGEVMIVDKDADRIEEMMPFAASGKIGNCTKPEVLRSFGVADFDACFVCIDSDFQSSLVITNLLDELGARKVYSEANHDMQEKFLLRGGANQVVFPEKDIAYRIAVRECCDTVFDYISLSGDYGIFEISVPTDWVDKTPRALNIRAAYNLTVLATKQQGQVVPILLPDYTFNADEHLLVMGHIKDVRKAHL